MKKCSVCGWLHDNDELRCSGCAKKGLRPTDKYKKEKNKKEKNKNGSVLKEVLDKMRFEKLIDYYPTYKE